MSVDVSAVYKSTIEHFKQAQKNIAIENSLSEINIGEKKLYTFKDIYA